jgi:hypothetical protein
MNTNCASYPQVILVLGFKNCLEDNSYLKSATPENLSWCKTRGIRLSELPSGRPPKNPSAELKNKLN